MDPDPVATYLAAEYSADYSFLSAKTASVIGEDDLDDPDKLKNKFGQSVYKLDRAIQNLTICEDSEYADDLTKFDLRWACIHYRNKMNANRQMLGKPSGKLPNMDWHLIDMDLSIMEPGPGKKRKAPFALTPPNAAKLGRYLDKDGVDTGIIHEYEDLVDPYYGKPLDEEVPPPPLLERQKNYEPKFFYKV